MHTSSIPHTRAISDVPDAYRRRSLLRSIAAWLSVQRELRHARRVLCNMSDRELKDIGLLRTQIDAAVYGLRRLP